MSWKVLRKHPRLCQEHPRQNPRLRQEHPRLQRQVVYLNEEGKNLDNTKNAQVNL